MRWSMTGDAQRTVVSLSGDLDIATAGAARQVLHSVLDDGAASLVVDLTGVGFLDSTALAVLVGVHKRLAVTGKTLQLVCPHRSILRLFQLTGLDRVFVIHASLAPAPD